MASDSRAVSPDPPAYHLSAAAGDRRAEGKCLARPDGARDARRKAPRSAPGFTPAEDALAFWALCLSGGATLCCTICPGVCVVVVHFVFLQQREQTLSSGFSQNASPHSRHIQSFSFSAKPVSVLGCAFAFSLRRAFPSSAILRRVNRKALGQRRGASFLLSPCAALIAYSVGSAGHPLKRTGGEATVFLAPSG